MFNLLAGLSLPLCVASFSAMAIIHNQSRLEMLVGNNEPGGGWEIYCGCGSVWVLDRRSDTLWTEELWRPGAMGILILFLWSGIPAKIHFPS